MIARSTVPFKSSLSAIGARARAGSGPWWAGKPFRAVDLGQIWPISAGRRFFLLIFLFPGAVEIRSVVLNLLWMIRVQFLAKKNTSLFLGVL